MLLILVAQPGAPLAHASLIAYVSNRKHELLTIIPKFVADVLLVLTPVYSTIIGFILNPWFCSNELSVLTPSGLCFPVSLMGQIHQNYHQRYYDRNCFLTLL